MLSGPGKFSDDHMHENTLFFHSYIGRGRDDLLTGIWDLDTRRVSFALSMAQIRLRMRHLSASGSRAFLLDAGKSRADPAGWIGETTLGSSRANRRLLVEVNRRTLARMEKTTAHVCSG